MPRNAAEAIRAADAARDHSPRYVETKRQYVYRGDSLTDPALKGKPCIAVARVETPDKCVRGRSKMLVRFCHEEHPRAVLARQLRRIKSWYV